MYLQHFDLAAAPFSITPGTAFAYGSRAQLEALNTLLLAIDDGEGFIKITGEVGTGKTLLCRRFMAALAGRESRYDIAYIPNPALSPRTLLLTIALELKLPLRADAPEHEILAALNAALVRAAADGRQVVVCLDEAQAMPADTIEALRLVTNLETEKRKLMQVVLFGQPELDHKLARPDLRQLRQRITFQYRLKALARNEVSDYVAHRLTIAGYSGPALFTNSALRSIQLASRGIPRLVNILAHKALLLVYAENGRQAERRHV